MTSLEITLTIIIAILVIAFAILLRYTIKFVRIIFIFEDEIGKFADQLDEVVERLNQVARVRVIFEHPTVGRYVRESFEEVKYCRILLLNMLTKARLRENQDYTILQDENQSKPMLHERLKFTGVYDPVEDYGVHIVEQKE